MGGQAKVFPNKSDYDQYEQTLNRLQDISEKARDLNRTAQALDAELDNQVAYIQALGIKIEPRDNKPIL